MQTDLACKFWKPPEYLQQNITESVTAAALLHSPPQAEIKSE